MRPCWTRASRSGACLPWPLAPKHSTTQSTGVGNRGCPSPVGLSPSTTGVRDLHEALTHLWAGRVVHLSRTRSRPTFSFSAVPLFAKDNDSLTWCWFVFTMKASLLLIQKKIFLISQRVPRYQTCSSFFISSVVSLARTADKVIAPLAIGRILTSCIRVGGAGFP